MKQMIFGVAIIAAMPFHFFKRHRSMKAVFYILSSIIGLTSCMERPDNSMIGLFKNKSNEQTKISQIKTDSVRNPYIIEYITPNVPLVSLTNVPDISLLNVPLFTGCN